MAYYMKLGLLPRRRVQFRCPDGCLYSEEVFGTEGFVGPTTTMYHIHPPTQVAGWKPVRHESGVRRRGTSCGCCT